jgi:hypothetical protein
MSTDVQESPISRVVVVVMEKVIGTEVLLESSPQLHRRGPTAGWRRGIAAGKGASSLRWRVHIPTLSCPRTGPERCRLPGRFERKDLKEKTVNCP